MQFVSFNFFIFAGVVENVLYLLILGTLLNICHQGYLACNSFLSIFFSLLFLYILYVYLFYIPLMNIYHQGYVECNLFVLIVFVSIGYIIFIDKKS